MSLFNAIVIRGSNCDEQPADKTPQKMVIVTPMNIALMHGSCIPALRFVKQRNPAHLKSTSLELHKPNTYDISAVGLCHVCWFAAASVQLSVEMCRTAVLGGPQGWNATIVQ